MNFISGFNHLQNLSSSLVGVLMIFIKRFFVVIEEATVCLMQSREPYEQKCKFAKSCTRYTTVRVHYDVWNVQYSINTENFETNSLIIACIGFQSC